MQILDVGGLRSLTQSDLSGQVSSHATITMPPPPPPLPSPHLPTQQFGTTPAEETLQQQQQWLQQLPPADRHHSTLTK